MHEQYSNPSRKATEPQCASNLKRHIVAVVVFKQRQRAQIKRRKQREDQDSHSPKPLTKLVPLLTSHLKVSSWLKAVAPVNMEFCESRKSGATLLLMIGVVAILDKDKNCVRLLI